MLRYLWLSLGLAFSLVGCDSRSNQAGSGPGHESGQQTKYIWTKAINPSPGMESYNFQMLTFRDTLWVFHPEGNWYSVDGVTWTKSTLPNAIGNLAFLDYVVFHDKLFGLGHFEGDVDEHKMKSTIYTSSNCSSWDSIEATNLPKRYFYHPFVFEDKIWMIGGEDETNIYSDIAQSPDGIHWQIMKDKLPFGPVSNSQFVLFQNKIWMLNNDVWSSSDGFNWEQVTKEIVPGKKIFGYAAVVYGDRIWLLGCNRNGQFSNEVLSSSDGVNWLADNASWSPRGGVAACLFKDKVYLTGGKYGGTKEDPDFIYSNDMWIMSPAKQ